MIPSHVQSLLKSLHAKSSTQEAGIAIDHIKSIKSLYAHDPDASKAQLDALMLDKFIALDEDKCLFIYQLLLAMGATTVVEAGTSFGVSTIYLALAVGENVKRRGDGNPEGKVVATEKEPAKAEKARGYWRECGEVVERWIDLKEGDLEETLNGDLALGDGQKVDALLLDSKCLLNFRRALTFSGDHSAG